MTGYSLTKDKISKIEEVENNFMEDSKEFNGYKINKNNSKLKINSINIKEEPRFFITQSNNLSMLDNKESNFIQNDKINIRNKNKFNAPTTAIIHNEQKDQYKKYNNKFSQQKQQINPALSNNDFYSSRKPKINDFNYEYTSTVIGKLNDKNNKNTPYLGNTFMNEFQNKTPKQTTESASLKFGYDPGMPKVDNYSDNKNNIFNIKNHFNNNSNDKKTKMKVISNMNNIIIQQNNNEIQQNVNSSTIHIANTNMNENSSKIENDYISSNNINLNGLNKYNNNNVINDFDDDKYTMKAIGKNNNQSKQRSNNYGFQQFQQASPQTINASQMPMNISFSSGMALNKGYQ